MLPPEVEKELRGPATRGISGKGRMILEALSTEPTSINDIIVNIWEKHGVAYKRRSLHARIHQLLDRGLMRRSDRGFYIITSRGQTVIDR